MVKKNQVTKNSVFEEIIYTFVGKVIIYSFLAGLLVAGIPLLIVLVV